MSDVAHEILSVLGRTTLALGIAAAAIGAVLRWSRAASPAVHRTGWILALLVGWAFIRVSMAVPWYDAPTVASVDPSAAEISSPSTESSSIPSPFVELNTTPAQQSASPSPLAGEGRLGGDGAEAATALPVFGPLPPGEAPVAGPGPVVAPPETMAMDTAAPPHFVAAEAIPEGARLGESSLALPDASDAVAPNPQPLTPNPFGTAANSFRAVAPIALAIWTAGAFLLVAIWFFGYARFVRRLPLSRPAEEAWAGQWGKLLLDRGVHRPIPLRVTENLGPMLCRLPRGYELLLPAGLWRELDDVQRAAILRHELAHYERCDVWKSLAARLLALPHWFNPFAWWAVRRFDEAAEWACDQVAATDAQGTAYAAALVRLGEAVGRQASYSPAARGRTLAGRVRRLLALETTEDSAAKRIMLVAAAVCLAALVLVRVDLVAKEPAAPAQQPEDLSAAAEQGVAAEGTEPSSDEEQEIHKHLVEAGRRNYQACRAAYATDTITLDLLLDASARLLAAEEVVATSTAERAAAHREHLARSKIIQAQVTALFNAGARGGEAEKKGLVDYVVADAERRLAALERQAKGGAAASTKAAEAPRATAADQRREPGQPEERSAEDTRLVQALVDAGRRHYEACQAAYASDTITFGEVLDASTRLLAAEQAAATTDEQRGAADRAHLVRVKRLQNQITALFEAHARGGEADKKTLADYYVAEAERRLLHNQRRQSEAALRTKTYREFVNESTQKAEDAGDKSQPDAAQGITWFVRPDGTATTKTALRYDGKSFDEWADLLRTELSVKRRVEAVGALAAFARRGYGREAVREVVEAMRGERGYQVGNTSDHGTMLWASLAAFRAVPTADAVAVLGETLKSDDASLRLFAVAVLDDSVRNQRPLPKITRPATLRTTATHSDKRTLLEVELNRVKTELKLRSDPAVGKALADEEIDKDEQIKDLKKQLAEWDKMLAVAKKPPGGADLDSIKRYERQRQEVEEKLVDRRARQRKDFAEMQESKVKESSAKLDILKSEKERLEKQAFDAAKIDTGDRPLISGFSAALEDDDPQVRVAALRVAARMPDNAEFSEALRKALADEDKAVVSEALKIVDELWPQPLGMAAAAGAARPTMGMGQAPPGGMRMGLGASKASGMTKMARTGALAPSSAGEATKGDAQADRTADVILRQLEILLESSDPQTSGSALSVLLRFGPRAKPAVPLLIRWLDSDRPDRPSAALQLVSSIGPDAAEAVPAIAKLLDKPGLDPQAVGEALGTLRVLGPAAKEAVPALIAIVEKRDGDLQNAAIQALGAIGPAAADAIPVLEKLAVTKLPDRAGAERPVIGLGGLRGAAPAPVEPAAQAAEAPHSIRGDKPQDRSSPNEK